MKTLLIAFIVGVISLAIGYFMGTLGGRMYMHQALDIIERSDALMDSINGLKEELDANCEEPEEEG